MDEAFRIKRENLDHTTMPPVTQPVVIELDKAIDAEIRIFKQTFGRLITEVFDVQAGITPATSPGRTLGRNRVSLSNAGNTTVQLRVDAVDPDEALGFRVRPATVTLPPGGTAEGPGATHRARKASRSSETWPICRRAGTSGMRTLR